MNKKIIKFLIYFFVLLAIIKFTPDIIFLIGKNFMQKQEYLKANSCFKNAYFLNKNNKNYKFYYVKSLTQLSPTIEVQKEVFDIASSDSKDSAQALAQSKINKWRNIVLQNIGDNYIEQVAINNGIMRWDTETFPIKIIILDNSNKPSPQYYRTQILKAFSQWNVSAGFLKFAVVNREKDANITIKIESIPENTCEGNICKYVAGFTLPEYNGKILKKMSITLYSTDPFGNFFSDKEIYNTILHEIGHALGIMGHSYNSEDLMYMEQNNNSNIYSQHKSSFQYLSSKDINTIKLLYKLSPDITNNLHVNTKGLIYPPIILGSSKDIANRKLKEAEHYVKKAPNMPNGYVDLALAYAELNRKNDAIKAMHKAYELSKSNDEKYLTAYNLASMYFEYDDNKNALKYAQIAKQLSPNSEIDDLITNIKFKKKY